MFGFDDLVHEAVLDIDAAGVGAREIADELLVGWRLLELVLPKDGQQRLSLRPQACAAVPNAQWQLLEERTNEVVWWAEVEFTPGDWHKTALPLRYLIRRIEKPRRPHADLLAPEATRKHLAIVSNDRKTPGPALLALQYARAGTIERLHYVAKK